MGGWVDARGEVWKASGSASFAFAEQKWPNISNANAPRDNRDLHQEWCGKSLPPSLLKKIPTLGACTCVLLQVQYLCLACFSVGRSRDTQVVKVGRIRDL